MTRKQTVSTGGTVEIEYEVYATSTTLQYVPWSKPDSEALFIPAIHYVHDGKAQPSIAPKRTLTVDGYEVEVPHNLPVRLGDVVDKVYQVSDGQDGFIPMTGGLIMSALQTLFATEFEEDQAAKLAEIQNQGDSLGD